MPEDPQKARAVKRVLVLATYFPSPDAPSRGNWALEQAQVMKGQVDDLEVIVPTPYLPRWTGQLNPSLKAYAHTPEVHVYSGLKVHYPRWPSYPWSVFNKFNRRLPTLVVEIGWTVLKYRIGRFIREFKPDGIIAHHSLVSGQLAYKINSWFGVPYVVVDHDTYDFYVCRKSEPVRRLFSRVASRASAMIVVSRAMEELARSALPGVDFTTIYNGSSFQVYRERDYRKSNNGLTLFCCSKFYRRKEIPTLMRAFDQLVSRGHDICLRIAGDGPDMESIRDLREKLQSRDRITLLGLLDSAEVQNEMQLADVFALVGWGEPFGVVYLEAMAAGLPIVLSEDAGVAEVLKNGVSAIFTKPRDSDSVVAALEAIISSSSLRENLGRMAQKTYLTGFSWQEINQQYRKLLERP